MDATRSPTATIVGNRFHGDKALHLAMATPSVTPVGTATIADNLFLSAATQGASAVDLKGAWQGTITGNTFSVLQSGALGLSLTQGPAQCPYPPGTSGSPSVAINHNKFLVFLGSNRLALRTPFGPVTTIDATLNDWNYIDPASISSLIWDGFDEAGRAQAIFEPFTYPSGGGGNTGCPYVLVGTNEGYKKGNTILGESENDPSSRSMVQDTYPLSGVQLGTSGRVKVRIAEWEQETTQLDRIGLLAVLRTDGFEIAPDPTGRLFSYRAGGDSLELARFTGQAPARLGEEVPAPLYAGMPGDSAEFRVSGGSAANPNSSKRRGVGISFRPKPQGRSLRVNQSVGITVRLSPDAEGDRWTSVGPLVPREEWSVAVVPFDQIGVQDARRVRIVWHSAHSVGWVGIVEVQQAAGLLPLECIEARHSTGRSVRRELASDDGSTVLLKPGDHIDLEFDASKASPGSRFALVARGRYDHAGLALASEVLPTSYSFRHLGPNPFNPEASLELRLPRQDRATIRIFDVAGRLVRVLLDEALPAGVHAFRWDGTDQRGARPASGVYFLELKAGDFTSRLRLVLLR